MKTEINPLKRELFLGFSQKQMSEVTSHNLNTPVLRMDRQTLQNISKNYLIFLNVNLMKFSKEKFFKKLRMNFSQILSERCCVLTTRRKRTQCM